MALCPNPDWFVMVVCGVPSAGSWAFFLHSTVKTIYREGFLKIRMGEEYKGIKRKMAADPLKTTGGLRKHSGIFEDGDRGTKVNS